jgi:hypothetical protein
MNFIPIYHVVEELLKNQFSSEQIRLKNYTGKNFGKEEASYLWGRILDHKWLISEKLKRNVGFRVASIDYLDNFHNANGLNFRIGN